MKPIVVVENLSKKYSRKSQVHLRYGLSDLWREIRGKQASTTLRKDEFLAVDDVSFHINPGESLGLIGRNGSGKTTLLKMMNGLIKPDAGTIIINGRVQALINLAAGFNPKLSGYDNIFNAGALMGMKKRDTQKVLDEIIAFSELETFIESPVDTYSSGMKARLGFSVAIHLQPQLLLLDEILSVGDRNFKNKCFTRMHELKKQGVTLVLVSHAPTQIIQICERALWLNDGKTMHLGESKEAMNKYLAFLDGEETRQAQERNSERELTQDETPQKGKAIARAESEIYGPVYSDLDRIDDLDVRLQSQGREVDGIPVHDSLEVLFSFRLKHDVEELNASLIVYRNDGLKLATVSTLNGDLLKDVHSGSVECRVTIPDFNLAPRTYALILSIQQGNAYLFRDVVRELVVTSNGRMSWNLIDLKYKLQVESSSGVNKSACYAD